MREIKFRAWNTEIKKWEFVTTGEDSSKEEAEKNHFTTSVACVFGGNNHCVIQQYTGLLDKNGVEIYEGDIVADKKIDGSIYQKEEVKWGTYNVGCNDEYDFYVNGAYVENEYMYSSMIDGSCEVIGNIYENPELLK